MTASWCACGLFWLLDWQTSLIDNVHRHSREQCHAINFTE